MDARGCAAWLGPCLDDGGTDKGIACGTVAHIGHIGRHPPCCCPVHRGRRGWRLRQLSAVGRRKAFQAAASWRGRLRLQDPSAPDRGPSRGSGRGCRRVDGLGNCEVGRHEHLRSLMQAARDGAESYRKPLDCKTRNRGECRLGGINGWRHGGGAAAAAPWADRRSLAPLSALSCSWR